MEGEAFDAYLKGGKEALQKVLYNQLIQSGVDPKLIEKMTPSNLMGYKDAKKQAEKDLLPNWYDPYVAVIPDMPQVPQSLNDLSDAANNAANSLDGLADSAGNEPRGADVVAYEQPDGSTLITNAPSETPAAIPQDISSDMPQVLSSVIESLSELPTTIQNVIEQIKGMLTPEGMTPLEEMAMPDFSGIEEIISNLATDIEEAFSSAVESFTETGNSFGEVTVQLSDLGAAIRDLITVQSQAQTQPQPVEVNTTVDIQEAHAWDYDHIEELANRVAQVIMPVVISAIGGDSNSY